MIWILCVYVVLCEGESECIIEMNEWKKKVQKLWVFIFGSKEKISSYVERKFETKTRLRRKNIVDAFDNSGGVD